MRMSLNPVLSMDCTAFNCLACFRYELTGCLLTACGGNGGLGESQFNSCLTSTEGEAAGDTVTVADDIVALTAESLDKNLSALVFSRSFFPPETESRPGLSLDASLAAAALIVELFDGESHALAPIGGHSLVTGTSICIGFDSLSSASVAPIGGDWRRLIPLVDASPPVADSVLAVLPLFAFGSDESTSISPSSRSSSLSCWRGQKNKSGTKCRRICLMRVFSCFWMLV